MDYDLEYKIEVKKEEEHESLFKWYIAQIDDEGKEVGFLTNKSIPWFWTEYFIFKNLRNKMLIKYSSFLFDSPFSSKTRVARCLLSVPPVNRTNLRLQGRP